MKNILIVVDMQKGFVGNDQIMQLMNRVADLLKKDIFDAVIATRFLNGENSIYEKLFNWKRLETEEEREIPPMIAEYADCIVDKYVYSCVDKSFLQRLCQINDGDYLERVFITGVDTDCCVLATAVSLYESNVRPIVLTQFVYSNGGEESHKAGLLCLERLIGEKQMSDAYPQTAEELDAIADGSLFIC